jgi:glycerol-3-phosphate cytidylyltransferase
MSSPNKRIYTYGVYDLFHVGHVRMLQLAKGLGNYLIVGLFTDEVAKGFKREPIIPLGQRAEILKSIKWVDKVVLQDSFSPEENIKAFEIDIVCKGDGAGWSKEKYPKFPGIKSVLLPYREGISTTSIIKRCYDNFQQPTRKD